jgi:hypothetical protein
MTFAPSFTLTLPREQQPASVGSIRFSPETHPGKLAGVEPWMYAGARRQLEILMNIAKEGPRK